MDDSSDDDLEIGPQKSAEELLRERERLAEARGDVVDVGADDADMPPAPVAVKPEKVKPERKPHLAYEEPVDEEDPERAPEEADAGGRVARVVEPGARPHVQARPARLARWVAHREGAGVDAIDEARDASAFEVEGRRQELQKAVRLRVQRRAPLRAAIVVVLVHLLHQRERGRVHVRGLQQAHVEPERRRVGGDPREA